MRGAVSATLAGAQTLRSGVRTSAVHCHKLAKWPITEPTTGTSPGGNTRATSRQTSYPNIARSRAPWEIDVNKPEPQTKEHFVVVDGYVPVIDLTLARAGDPADRKAIAATIDETCRDSGFLVVTGHGIAPDLIQRMHDASLAFFLLPEEIKDQYLTETGDPTIRGFYKTASYVAASDDTPTAPDLCQLYTVCRLGEPGVATHESLGDDYDVWSKPNPWPTEVDTFKHVWLEYYDALEALSADLMRLFALGLGLDEDFFDDKIDDHITNLVANYYPPVDEEPLEGQYRKGPHSDWGTLTVLYQDDTGGLEVLDRNNDEWLDVPVVPGSFVVNIGDLMSVWTNDQWQSTKHRVRVPPPEKRANARVSLPYFHQPNWSLLVECLPSCIDDGAKPNYEPVTSGAYLLKKIQMAYE